MKRIRALPEGAGHENHNPAFKSVLINLVTPETRAAEGGDLGAQAAMGNRAPYIHAGRWRQIVCNRIAFRHDERRGPMSATLWGSVY